MYSSELLYSLIQFDPELDLFKLRSPSLSIGFRLLPIYASSLVAVLLNIGLGAY